MPRHLSTLGFPNKDGFSSAHYMRNWSWSEGVRIVRPPLRISGRHRSGCPILRRERASGSWRRLESALAAIISLFCAID